jgi:hypothetical protein
MVQTNKASASRQLTSLKVAEAAAGVEAALATLRSALQEDAQQRVSATLASIKRGLTEGEDRFEALVARVPAFGPWLAMEMYRVTHAVAEDLPVAPTNTEEPLEAGTVSAYLECIGCHVA